MVKASINGFGRIGRTAFRVFFDRPDLHDQLDIVAINTSGSMDTAGWGHALKYDTAYRAFPHPLSVEAIKSPKEATEDDPVIGYFHIYACIGSKRSTQD